MKRQLFLSALAILAALAFAPASVSAETTPAPVAGAAESVSAPAAPTSPAPSASPSPAAPAPSQKKVTARVLRGCQFGACDDVVELPADVAKEAERQGLIDTGKEAVAYARGLDQNKPKPKPDPA